MLNIVKYFGTTNTTPRPKREIDWIVIHYTAGVTSKTGSALSLAKGYKDGTMTTSSDFVVDDTTVVQYNQDMYARYTWGAGGNKYPQMSTSLGGKYYGICKNANCINIEMCSNKKDRSTLNATDDDWYFTDEEIDLLVELTKYLMDELNIDIDHVIMHHHVTGKICPNPWTLNESRLQDWYDFLKKVNDGKPVEIQKQNQPVTSTSTKETTAESTNIIYPATPFIVKVIVSDLNYRTAPNMSGAVKGQTGKGAFTITQVSGDWGKLKGNGYWIYLKNPEYCTIPKVETKFPYLVTIVADALNVRSGPGTNYKITTVVRKGGIYTITEEQNGWGKLKSGAGWISLNYAKKN